MKLAFCLVIVLVFIGSPVAMGGDLSRADLSVFFDRIYFVSGNWEFKFSAGSLGMLWRVKNGGSDVSGACISGQVLKVVPGSSLQLKRNDLVLDMEPAGPVRFNVRLSLKPDPKVADPGDEQEAFLIAKGNGFALVYARD